MNDLSASNSAIVISIEKQIRLFRWLTGIVVAVGGLIAAWATFWFAMTPEELDHMGGFLGGTVVSLWSLAGILLIYVAFLGQRLQIVYQEEEIRLNRQVLEETRSEMARQREQMEQQSAIFRAQSFESTFFHLLSLHHEIVAAIAVRCTHGPRKGEMFTGRDAFEELYRDFKQNFRGSDEGPDSEEERVAIDRDYRRRYRPLEVEFGHYFRNLYRIIKLVDQSGLEVPKQYSDFARAQLSSYELACLFYSCLSAEGLAKFKPLVEKYTLLKNLPRGLLLDEQHVKLYSPNAFTVVRHAALTPLQGAQPLPTA